METTPKTLHIFSLEPQGGIYSHQGRGGARRQALAQNAAGAAAQAAFPRPYWGRARGASSRARSHLSHVRFCARF